MATDKVGDIGLYFNHGLYVPTRTIVLEDDGEENEVGSLMYTKFFKGIDVLEKNSMSEDITIILNTPGGSVDDMWAIYDRILESPCDITIKAYGSVASAGSIILQSANNRLLSANCTYMMHEGGGAPEDIKTTDLRLFSEWTEESVGREVNIYYKAMRQKNKRITKSKIRGLLKDNKFLWSDDAIKLGLADGIIEVAT